MISGGFDDSTQCVSIITGGGGCLIKGGRDYKGSIRVWKALGLKPWGYRGLGLSSSGFEYGPQPVTNAFRV